MKYIYYTFLFIVITSCNSNKTKNTEEARISLINQSSSDSTDIILNKLEQFVSHVDNIKHENDNYYVPDVIIVSFNQANKTCYLNIQTQTYYEKELLDGYLILNKKFIAFYNTKDSCNCGIVNMQKLSTGVDSIYPDENSPIATAIYEPLLWSFKIHNKDSLEFMGEYK